MQHKGQALEKAVRESGIPLTKITKRMNKSRRWIYNAFENPNLGIDYIIEIGEIIHYDFSDVLVELKKFRATLVDKSDATDKEGSEYWKNKYLDLLEKYNETLERKLV